jgi:pyruvate kinase
MDRIASATEAQGVSAPPPALLPDDADTPVTLAACMLADQVGADAVVVPTLSGRTARLIARCRPACAIVAPVPRAEVRRRLALVWGVAPVPLSAYLPPGSDRLGAAMQAAFAAGAVRAGQRVIVLAGHPVMGGGWQPTLRLVRVGAGGDAAEP